MPKRRRADDDPEDPYEFDGEGSPEPYDFEPSYPRSSNRSRRRLPVSRPIRYADSEEDSEGAPASGKGKDRVRVNRKRDARSPSRIIDSDEEATLYDDDIEVLETDELLNFGQPPLVAEDGASPEEMIPIRRLTNFSIFDPSHDNQMRTLFELDGDESAVGPSRDNVPLDFIAHGIVEPVWEDAEDDDALSDFSESGDEDVQSSDGIKARLTTAWLTATGPNSSKIWIRTTYAWYELGVPSKEYAPYYRDYWLGCRLSYLVLNAIRKKDHEEQTAPFEWADFIKSLERSSSCSDEVAEAGQILGRSLTADDVLAHRKFIYQEALDCQEYSSPTDEYDFDSRHPIFQVIKTGRVPRLGSAQIFRRPFPDTTRPREQTRNQPREQRHARPPRILDRARRRDIETQILKNRNPTYVTPRVAANAKYFFSQVLMHGPSPEDFDDEDDEDDEGFEAPFGLMKLRLDDLDQERGDSSSPLPPSSPTIQLSTEDRKAEQKRIKPSMRWCRKKGSLGGYQRVRGRVNYEKIMIDGIKYKIGDFVIIPIDSITDDHPKRVKSFKKPGSQSSNTLANHNWFAEIVELFEEQSNSKMAHVRWYDHASKTLLQEAHHPREIFPINQCYHCLDCSLIAGKCVVTRCGPDNDPPRYKKGTPKNHLFYRRRWEVSTSSFHDLDPPLNELRHEPGDVTCIPCHLEEDKAKHLDWRFSPSRNAIHLADRVYHQFDHAFIIPEDDDKRVYDIVQILDLHPKGRAGKVQVCWYSRHSQIPDVEKKEVHRLYRTSKEGYLSIRDLRAPCQVEHYDRLSSEQLSSIKGNRDPEVFYTSESFRGEGEAPSIKDLKRLRRQDFSSCEDCKKERESARRASASFKKDRVLDLFCAGGGFSQGFVNAGYAEVKWGVDFSPAACETFQAKHHDAIVYNQCLNLVLEKAVEETETGNSRPRLRSIGTEEPLPSFPRRGQVDLMLAGPQCTGYSGLNRFKSATDVRNTLIAATLSYVEHLLPSRVVIENVGNMATSPLRGQEVNGKLQGGIEWGTHKFILRTFLDLGYQVRFSVLQAGDFGTPQSRRRLIYFAALTGRTLPEFPLPTHHFHKRPQYMKLPTWGNAPIAIREDGCAPHFEVTVRDAISDLPEFDWLDPSGTVDKRNTIQTFTPRQDKQFHGYSSSKRYANPPSCDYQEWIRGGQDRVTLNHTIVFDDNTISRVCNIPARRDADHRSLPKKLEVRAYMGSTGSAARNRLYPGMYGRVPWDGTFQTMVTRINPGHKQGRVLHPDQRRVLSVREYARAQGFSDDTEFISPSNNENDLYRIIGNAMPIPLGMALARCVGLAALTDQRERGPVDSD